jgi:hypothetical protein
MKITGPGGVSQTSSSSGTRAAVAPGFAVSTGAASETASAVRTAAASGVASLDALLALQALDEPMERRRRAMRRAGRLLDVLDEVKIALLGGANDAGALQRLAQAVREQREETDDSRLEGVLDQVDARAAVELAKAEMSRLAA